MSQHYNNQQNQPWLSRLSLSQLNKVIIAIVVIDAFLIISAIVLAGKALSSPSTPQASSITTPATPSDNGNNGEDSTDTTDNDAESDPDDDESPTVAPVMFASPSGNIWCDISSEGATCSIAKLGRKPEKNQAGCQGYIGYVVKLSDNGTELPCITENEVPKKAEKSVTVLNYGSRQTVHNFTCESSQSGMKCLDTTSSRGFNVARAGIATF
ncbi:hypothetical protein [Timonella sp. A28]|uniref:hypothetical protein n=1 Tax=Timonella sp. A28 TaxID=3442640 RepID=UPI003EBFEF8B